MTTHVFLSKDTRLTFPAAALVAIIAAATAAGGALVTGKVLVGEANAAALEAKESAKKAHYRADQVAEAVAEHAAAEVAARHALSERVTRQEAQQQERWEHVKGSLERLERRFGTAPPLSHGGPP